MRVLIAFIDDEASNPFVRELKEGLESVGCDVTWSLTRFWKKEGKYDIVHLQWPEYLFLPVNNDTDVAAGLDRLRETLMFWKRSSRIVLTRHNQKPHLSHDRDLFYERLYDLVYSYCDGFVHLGPFELEKFKQIHSTDVLGNTVNHIIIPHHIYVHSYYGSVDRRVAKESLGIKSGRAVILVYGRIRLKRERAFLRKLFKATRDRNICFLVPTWLPFELNKGLLWKLRHLYYDFKLILLNRSSNIIAFRRFVKDEDTYLYFDAADIVLIPRLEELNSGNVTLGYYFGKVVVGPAIGNIQHELKETGNPTFIPASLPSVVRAIDYGLSLVNANKGLENRQYVFDNRLPSIIGREYLSFYIQCLNTKRIDGLIFS